jgi:hypothetical protein
MMVRMPEQQQQDYSNHVRRVPGFIALVLVMLVTFLGALVNLYMSWGDHERLYSAALIVVLTGCTFCVAGFARGFALKAQDRAIRAEENLRSFVLTGKLLDPRLTVFQITAIRFAADGEFPDLAKQAAEKGTAPDAIKKSVKNWRGDFHRV